MLRVRTLGFLVSFVVLSFSVRALGETIRVAYPAVTTGVVTLMIAAKEGY